MPNHNREDMLRIRQKGVLRANYIILYLLLKVEGHLWARSSNEFRKESLMHSWGGIKYTRAQNLKAARHMVPRLFRSLHSLNVFLWLIKSSNGLLGQGHGLDSSATAKHCHQRQVATSKGETWCMLNRTASVSPACPLSNWPVYNTQNA